MALIEGCKHSLEISVPVEAITEETGKVVDKIQKRARIPGFRPGKAPSTLIRKQFQSDVRQQVLESLVPVYFEKELEKEHLKIVGSPNIVDVHFHDGEPLRFKAEFEVAPEIELKEYRGLSVPYHEPEVTDEDIDKRLEEIREDKATFANEDPRPLAGGDFAVLSLESISGVDEPVKSDEMTLEVGGKDTLPAFTENLQGMSPGDEKDFEIVYPGDYGQAKLAGKTVRFHMTVKGVRRKELPELNDEFAQDIGDYRSISELRDAVRKSIFAQRQYSAQQAAKGKLVDALVKEHDFPVPEVFIERQIKNRVEQRLTALASEGIDPNSFKLDWEKVKSAQHDSARDDVKASLLLGLVAEREAIVATREEVDREVERIARQRRETVPAVRKKLQDDGTIGRIASHIQTEKTLTFLFENATKTVDESTVAEAAVAEQAEE